VKFSKDDADIYVADNNSDDDSVDFLKINFPEVKIRY
jgi:GT2 family glycosyltransferase